MTLTHCRTAAEIKSRKCSESAKCRNNRDKYSNESPVKNIGAENDSVHANASTAGKMHMYQMLRTKLKMETLVKPQSPLSSAQVMPLHPLNR